MRETAGNDMRLVLCICLSWLAGCSVLATKEAAIGCQVADIATTYRALHLNPLAYETNALPLPILLALKIGLIVWIWRSDEWKKEPEAPRALVTIIGCTPVPGNLKAARYNGSTN